MIHDSRAMLTRIVHAFKLAATCWFLVGLLPADHYPWLEAVVLVLWCAAIGGLVHGFLKLLHTLRRRPFFWAMQGGAALCIACMVLGLMLRRLVFGFVG